MDVIGGNNKKSTHIVDRPIDFNEVPDIPENLEYSDLHLLIPKGFEDLIEFELQNTTFMLTLLQGDQQQNKVGIDRSLYNPKASNTYFPKFCFEVSSFKSSRKVDYFGSHANHVLNQNQMIYMALQHRLVIFKSSPNSYTYLLSNDLKAVRSFIGNNYPKAYNAQKKVDNTWVILSPWDRLTSTATKPRMKILSSHGFPCIGEILARKAFKPLNQHWPMIFAQLPVQPSSESSLSTTAKVTVSPHSKHNQLFRSVGFSNDDTTFTSIFKHAQNLAARLKTHLIAEAFEVADSSESVFAQDWQFNQQRTGYIPRDKCLREVVVVFRKMNRDTNQFLAGEIEASPAFVDTLIHQEISKTELFDQINIEVGQVKSCLATNEFVLGNLLEDPDKLVTIKNVTQVQCLSREIQGVAGVEKVKLRVTRKAGNARIDSNTGIKGVTKCKPNLGTVYYKDESLGFPFVPDLLLGGNATKAKENTIALAKAAFAVKHGFYKPPRKGNLLNTLDPVEVNAAVQACPEFVYIDEFGQEQTAHVGIAYVRFTELASTYGGKLKELSYMFEAGRFLYQNGNKDYFKYIWSNFVKQKYIDIITELTKVQHDLGNSFPEDGLPYFSPKDIASNNIIKPEDLVLSRIASYPVRSKLLDEEWNKGFYIDLSGMSGPIIRIPSAKVLNYMVSQLPDRTWSYPNLLVRISNILNYCMYTSEDKRQRIGYIFARDGSDRLTEQVAYLREVKSILYTGNTGSQMLVQKLLKPEITGFSKKQVVDQFLPPNTCVIFDQQLYNNCVKEMYKNSDDPDYDYLINGLRFDHIRNPVLWISQYADLRVWTRDDFAHHLAVNHNIQLDQYLDTERNKDIIFIDIYSVVEKGHADNDGDLCPNTIVTYSPDRPKFKPMQCSKQEHEWNRAYFEGEFEADAVMDKPIVYTLYDIPYRSVTTGRKKLMGYDNILINALVAKNAIGPATNDGWVFSMITECYRSYRKEHFNYVDETGITTPMFNITDEDFVLMTFSYIRGLQDFVVTGVKHNDDGAAGFEMLYLDNFSNPKNQKDISNLFLIDFKLNPQIVNKIFSVINWAAHSGMLDACKAFLRLYNKGVEPTDKGQIKALAKHGDFVQSCTFFGMLVQPIYDITAKVKVQKQQTILELNEMTSAISFEL